MNIYMIYIYIYVCVCVCVCVCVHGWMDGWMNEKQGIPRMILFVIKSIDNVKLIGFFSFYFIIRAMLIF